jgi:hypothetical protein
MTARETVSRLHIELLTDPRIPLLHKRVHRVCISAGIDGTARMLIQTRDMRPGALMRANRLLANPDGKVAGDRH